MKLRHPRPHRTRKIITRAIVFLLLGALVNVAVAWGCAVWSIASNSILLPVAQSDIAWLSGNGEKSSPTWDAVEESKGIGIYDRQIRLSDPAHEIPILALPPTRSESTTIVPSPYIAGVRVVGWPRHSFDCEYWVHTPAWASLHGRRPLRSPPLDLIGGQVIAQKILPIRPLWNGLMANTVAYAIALMLLYYSVLLIYARAFRRRRRIMRGLCPACAYPVGTSEVCTECGKPVKITPQER